MIFPGTDRAKNRLASAAATPSLAREDLALDRFGRAADATADLQLIEANMIRYIVMALAICALFANRLTAEEPELPFNGKDLTGWEGDPKVWSVEDGAIVGRTTADAPIKNNTFLIWRAGNVGDFRLQLEYRIEGGNSGVQYRSKVADPAKWIVGGYQADIDSEPVYSGILYDERGTRHILANRGERASIDAGGKKTVERFADAAELQKNIRNNDWNEYIIEARGPHLRHTINGKLMSECEDKQEGKRADSGILALQVHQGPPMTVRFRKIRLERLDGNSPERAPE
jgi:hypothetical protein